MRRFVAIALVIMALIVGGYFVTFYTSLRLTVEPGGELQTPYRVMGKTLQRQVGEGYEDLQLRGVELSSAVPGHHFSDYAITGDDYSRWFGQISEMGANTLVVTQLMDDEFYDALLAYNESHDEPLLLVQGITVEESYEQDAENAYASGLMSRLTSQGEVVVDAIHGRRDVSAVGIGGSGSYRSDVSPWVAALLVMDEFDVDTVAYTDGSSMRDGSYEGKLFRTTSDATPFEAMLAQVLDDVTSYETEKYLEQRPVGFTCSPLTDPLVYDDTYARQLRKYVCVNPDHVEPTSDNSAGRIGAYRIADVVGDYQDYLSVESRTELAQELASVDATALYGGYLQLLSAYHDMPLLGFYASSTARASASMDTPMATEREQGEALLTVCDALEDASWAGAIITSWQDVWARNSWNTRFATYDTNVYKWHDLQTPTQCEGLLAFDPGEERICVLDGRDDEWTEADLVCAADGGELYARQDAEGLYLLVRGVTQGDTVYVPLDVSPEVGVSSCANPPLSFAGDPEFLLCLEGTENSRLLVQSRYNATRERFQYEIDETDPFIDVIAADDTTFEVVRLAQENDQLLTEAQLLAKEKVYLGLLDTGALVHGNGDPSSSAYNSLADFCYGSDCVEVRIPWLMLNFGDPSSRLVHRDYYDCYGVEFKQVTNIGAGLAVGGGTEAIEMADFKLDAWQDVTYTERLKESYDVVRAAWGGDV